MDDEPMIRDAGGEMLGHLGYQVAVAENGEEAVRLYAEARAQGRGFAAVIMDLTVPGGLEALRRLEDLDPEVAAIVSSGYSNDPIMGDYRKHGFRGVVAKPYRIQELAEAVKEVLARPSHGRG
jgi:CheY-like chemotaxis protein